ncbi:MAG: transaldolase [Candidatus Levybacteria bacterium CG10_big_fil_rev_8_21_14_0_10_35_13]|nr:MAG: transaldolase [Candidatus Levybacteria bacterium CG10_big_fil_rev_8_21_14_0_10_35_13]
MSKPNNLNTRIFLDGGIPEETKDVIKLLGFLDGQTTNPTLITKHPSFLACQARGEKCTEEDGWKYYKEIVSEISPLVKNGSVSIEVYADRNTKAEEMITKGEELFQWIPNAHVKLPITTEGLKAAGALVSRGIRVNMTLCFTQQQAAAVFAATKAAKKGDVFVSPFIGRLDDKGENGMSLIENILKMYKEGDGHVEVLVASVRNIDHFLRSLQLKADIITSPFKILKDWKDMGMSTPDDDYQYKNNNLKDISYQELDLSKDWQEFNISDDLTDKGIERFSQDWNALITK